MKSLRLMFSMKILYSSNLTFVMCCLCIVLMTSACGAGAVDDEKNNSAFNLIEEDFTASSILELSPEEFVAALNETEDFLLGDIDLDTLPMFSQKGEDTLGVPQETIECVNDLVGDPVIKKSSGNTFRILIGDISVTNCFKFLGFDLESVYFSFYYDNLILVDKSGNEVNVEGKRLNELFGVRITQGNVRFQMHMSGELVVNNNSIKFSGESISSENSTGQFNDPCFYHAVLTDCTLKETYHYHYPDDLFLNFDEVLVLNAHDLKITDGGPYYIDGNITFTLNDWNGTMTYSSDATSPPDYEATNGVDNISGTYGSSEFAASSKPGLRADSVEGNVNLLNNVINSISNTAYKMQRLVKKGADSQ